jgi:UDP-N-acetyl-2-amino-2-deoxyglucuronate dehydrogenase
MTHSPLRVAVVGAGMIGHVHAEVVSSLRGVATLAAVVDSDAPTASRVAARLGTEALTSLAEACARPDIDVVSICLPSGTHASAAIPVMRAGKHVVIEKPIDITLDAADALIRVERETGVVATVISQRRFQRAPAFLQRAVRSGELGRITSGVAVSPFWRTQEYYESGSWRGTKNLDGGGALMNQGVHVLDLLVWLLGEPVEVQAYAGTLAHRDIEVEDTAAAVIRFASGAIGTILATTAAYPDLPVRLSIHGADGSAVLDGDELQFFHARTHESAPPGKADQTADLLPDRGLSTLDDALRDQYLDLALAIATGKDPSITTADGRRALATVLAIYESAETGRAVAVR